MADYWHRLDAAAVAEQLGVDPRVGLIDEEPARRRAEIGPNTLTETGGAGPWRMLWQQFTSTMVLILIVAAAVSIVAGDAHDAAAILVIVLLNAALGFGQEYRASRAMAALKQLAVPTVRVRRNGRVHSVPAPDTVPGDVMVLEAGDVVAADGRVLHTANLRTQEAALTGESEPVEKTDAALDQPDLAIADRRNIVFMGTVVTYGRGEAIVTATGMRTELGRVATLLQGVGAQATPLQKRLDRLGQRLALAALIIVAFIFALGIWRGEPLKVMFFTAVSMAVAAMPEGLPAVVTIALALGARRMIARNALVRKLSSVEALGSVTVICSDKTGTLTQNQMSVAALEVSNCRLEGGALDAAARDADLDIGLSLLLTGGALCNDAMRNHDETRFRGDPTEVALVSSAERAGLAKHTLDQRFPRVAEIPFDSDRRRMTTVHQILAREGLPKEFANAGHVAFTKGAVDDVVAICANAWVDGAARPMSRDYRTRIAKADRDLAGEGMRVLGLACRALAEIPQQMDAQSFERDLVFVGLFALIDPPRAEVRDAVETCRRAGVRPVMITGDHPLTARHIARELDIVRDEAIVTGADLDAASPAGFAGRVDEARVFARVSPEHKLRIVEALQSRSHVVAMTGDGVNDAPALKKADIGVAMGVTGTDVSKEAADIVLLDDNFATIVAAVEEGRVIYDNIRRFVKYLLTTNSAELWVMAVAPIFGMPLPLQPLQILWINLVTDGPAALTLALEPAERNVMKRPPIDPRAGILAHGMGAHVVWVGMLMGVVTLGTGYWYWSSGAAEWQTMVFTVLALSQMAHAMAIRSHVESLFRIGLFSNPHLLAAVLLTVVLQLAIIYIPYLQQTLATRSLSARDLGIALALSSVTFCAVEIEKAVLRARRAVA